MSRNPGSPPPITDDKAPRPEQTIRRGDGDRTHMEGGGKIANRRHDGTGMKIAGLDRLFRGCRDRDGGSAANRFL